MIKSSLGDLIVPFFWYIHVLWGLETVVHFSTVWYIDGSTMQRRNRKQKRRSRTARRGRGGNAYPPVTRPFPYQREYQFWLTGADQLQTTTLVGNINNVVTINPSLAVRFSDLSALFDEYRVMRCDFLITPIGYNNGVSRYYIDEDDGNPPTGATCQAHVSTVITNNSDTAARFRYKASTYTGNLCTWTPQSTVDLNWENVASPTDVAFFKFHTDTTLGSPVSTLLFMVRIFITIHFRGLQ